MVVPRVLEKKTKERKQTNCVAWRTLSHKSPSKTGFSPPESLALQSPRVIGFGDAAFGGRVVVHSTFSRKLFTWNYRSEHAKSHPPVSGPRREACHVPLVYISCFSLSCRCLAFCHYFIVFYFCSRGGWGEQGSVSFKKKKSCKSTTRMVFWRSWYSTNHETLSRYLVSSILVAGYRRFSFDSVNWTRFTLRWSWNASKCKRKV